MKVCYRIVALVVAVLFLVSCSSGQVNGNGKVVTKTRQVSSFNKVQISGAYNVRIVQGTVDSLKITTDSNIEPLVMTNVDGGTLIVRNKKGVTFNVKQPVTIQIVVKQIKQISASGMNQLMVTQLNGKKLLLDTTGAIRASLMGKIGKFVMNISGSGNVNASKLVSNNVKVRLTGSGQVKVNAVDKLDSTITGSGSVLYAGNPNDIDQSIVGSGKLERIK